MVVTWARETQNLGGKKKVKIVVGGGVQLGQLKLAGKTPGKYAQTVAIHSPSKNFNFRKTYISIYSLTSYTSTYTELYVKWASRIARKGEIQAPIPARVKAIAALLSLLFF